MNDAEIISLYFNRDENAIKETKSRYGILLTRISFDILRNNEDSEECVNTTYLNTWHAIPPTFPKSLCAFVCRIARNTAINLLKKLSRNKAESIYEELEDVIADNSNPQDIIEANALTSCIDRYLDTIKSRNRQIFVMRYYYNLSMRTIGDCFGMNEEAVRAQLLRTRSGLRSYLKENGIEV